MISLAELKAALKVTHSAEDDYITDLEAAAVTYVERETGRYFGAETAEVVFILQGSGTSLLFLPEYSSSVTAVSSRHYAGGTETEILPGDADGWELRIQPGSSHSNRLIRKGGHVWHPALEYPVTATIGFAAGEEPADIRHGVVQLVTLWYVQRMPIALRTVAPVPFSVRDVINAHRRLVA